MMAEWYRTGDFRSALMAFDAAWLEQGAPEGDAKRNPLRAAETMNVYRQVYEKEPFTIVDVEIPGALPVGSFILTSIIDLLTDYPGYGMLPIDHKTTSSFGEGWWMQMHPNHQYSGYLLTVQSMFGEKCTALMVNGILTDKQRCLFNRKPTNRSRWELDQWVREMNFHVEHQLKPCYEKNEWPQNDDYCQRWNFFGGGSPCEYHSLCTTIGVDYRQLEAPRSQFKEEKWNPLHERR